MAVKRVRIMTGAYAGAEGIVMKDKGESVAVRLIVMGKPMYLTYSKRAVVEVR